MTTQPLHTENGFTIMELTVALSLAAIMATMAWLNMKELVNPAQNGAATLASFIKEVRARAISTTSAYTIRPLTANRLQAHFAATCSDIPAADNKMTLELPEEVSMTDITWEICFNSRGLPDSNLTVTVVDPYDGEREVEVFLGGGVRFL